MDKLDMYLLIIMIAIGGFVFVLRKVLSELDKHGFAKSNLDEKIKENFYEQSKKALLKNNQTNDKAKLYDEFCDFINIKINELKEKTEEKECLSTFIKELTMVQGQNSNEEKLQKNLFRFLRELEECVKNLFGEDEAIRLKNELGSKYNELFS